jgi:hypothetical protein
MILLYDGTFDGLLSAIFDVYRLKLTHFEIIPALEYKETLFQPLLRISTNKSKANRIKLGLKKKTQRDNLPFLHFIFTKKKEKEKLVYAYIKAIFEPKLKRMDQAHLVTTK